MPNAPLMLGVSGLRGIVGQSLTPEVAARYAAAFGTWLAQRTGTRRPIVMIGRDGRADGEAIYHAAIAGLLGAGCDVVTLGVVATPTVGFMMQDRAHGGMVVTASHNPQEWNGLKCLITDEIEQDGDAWDVAHAPEAGQAREIIDLFERGPAYATPPALCRVTPEPDGAEVHWANMLAHFAGALAGVEREDLRVGLRCVLDSVNCSGASIAEPFLDEVACVVQLHGLDTGIFPHTPEPTAENLSGAGGLCDAVPGLGADAGFAQDPDADRLAIVDETGRYIGEEYTLVLAARALLLARAARDDDDRQPVIVVNLSTSRMIDDVAAGHGARVVRTAVGEANVVEAMKRLRREGEDVVMGGEGNGGVIWPEVTYVRDSLGAMALVLALMARAKKKLSELVAEIPAYQIVKRKVDLPSRDAATPAIEKIAAAYSTQRIDLQDGVRVDWDDAWLHVRPSNTEPIMRLIAEAPTRERAEEILDRAAGVISI